MISALAVNWAYTKEHDAAANLPPLSFRQLRRSLVSLLRSRPWVIAFGTETAGWVVYVVALRLAPLSLVQAVSASGIAVLVLLALSLVGSTPVSHSPQGVRTVIWLSASAATAIMLMLVQTSVARVAVLGVSAGLLFSSGDVSAKLVSFGGIWLVALLPLVACYATGTGVLQRAFQHGSALTAAGLATLVTNAVPIAAGFVLFDEALPHGPRGALQIASFAAIVCSAALLGRATAAQPE